MIYLRGQVWCKRGYVYLNNILLVDYYQNADVCDAHSNATSALVFPGDKLTSSGPQGSIYFVPFK